MGLHSWCRESYFRLPEANLKSNCSVFEGWQGLQHLTGPGARENRIVLANFSVSEHQYAFGKLCDIVLVSDQHNREPRVVQALEDVHDLDRGTTIEIAGRFVG